MRISSKGRYAIASMITLSQHYNTGECVTVASISEKLGISKIYLEQVFSLLKRGELVLSVKGSQGGYQLSRMPRQITVLDILSSVEDALLERTEETVEKSCPEMEKAMRLSAFDVLENAIRTTLQQITLYDLVNETEKHKTDQDYMYFI